MPIELAVFLHVLGLERGLMNASVFITDNLFGLALTLCVLTLFVLRRKAV